jgi:hypothetical protein
VRLHSREDLAYLEGINVENVLIENDLTTEKIRQIIDV